jgi:hypothetical protein
MAYEVRNSFCRRLPAAVRIVYAKFSGRRSDIRWSMQTLIISSAWPWSPAGRCRF